MDTIKNTSCQFLYGPFQYYSPSTPGFSNWCVTLRDFYKFMHVFNIWHMSVLCPFQLTLSLVVLVVFSEEL
jgi:hypothetical protein